MKQEGKNFELEQGEMIKNAGENPAWIEGPAKGTLSERHGVLYATVGGQEFELLGGSISDFPDLVMQDPTKYLQSDKGKAEDANQDNLDWLKPDKEE